MSTEERFPFNLPYMVGAELEYIKEAHSNGVLAGDGPFTKKCHEWLEKNLNCKKALLTHSCTAALEMCALLLDLEPGDEVIMPSFTFVSTANAFVLRGAVPVFVDIRADTLNLDESKVEVAITKRTKAIVVVHYAGVACEMDVIIELAKKYNLIVIEDAAQAIMSTYKGRYLGSVGHLGAFSFHETKNIISGEGGALLINGELYEERAEIIREKGTNRSKFFRGQVDKYSWVDIGSSYLPGEVIAAFLWAQLQHAQRITDARKELWLQYHESLKEFECEGLFRRPIIPEECGHNAHMYYILLPNGSRRDDVLKRLNGIGVNAVFHYVPLHISMFGQKAGRSSSELEVTESVAARILRLPLWIGLDVSRVVQLLQRILAA